MRKTAVALFQDPTFQNRVAAAGKARQKALDQLKAKPRVDADQLAEQRRAWEVRERSLAEERAAKTAAKAALKAEKALNKAQEIAAAEAAAALKAARLTPTSAADMKAARDARYAARKARK